MSPVCETSLVTDEGSSSMDWEQVVSGVENEGTNKM